MPRRIQSRKLLITPLFYLFLAMRSVSTPKFAASHFPAIALIITQNSGHIPNPASHRRIIQELQITIFNMGALGRRGKSPSRQGLLRRVSARA
ncbi:hypothetical protein CEXT_611791 [Caerostris extrusa]|uniref:Secreted protein n=1 Tax=Caerostris extrusa TaxID=172846 RepID=A0AAV4U131_CAEEX|nr:hypothetical protein CEXT_611791 [Caerostris extrusa]